MISFWLDLQDERDGWVAWTNLVPGRFKQRLFCPC